MPEDEQLPRINEFLDRLRDDREWGGEETMLHKCTAATL